MARLPPWAQEHELLHCFPSYLPHGAGLETLRSSGELSITDVRVNARLPLAIKGLVRKSLHFLTVESLSLCFSHACSLLGPRYFAFSLLSSSPVFFPASQGRTPLKPLLNILIATPLSALHECSPSLQGGGGGLES